MNPSTKLVVPYPRFTKLIIDHVLSTRSNIPKRLNELRHWFQMMRLCNLYLHLETLSHDKRKQPDPELSFPTAEQIDLDNITECKILNYTLANSAQEAEAQANVKLLEQHLLDKDVKQIVEGDESDANKFVDDIIMSQEYFEEEEETIEAALIQKKRKGSLEIKDTPLFTPTRSHRIETLSMDKDSNVKLVLKKIDEVLIDLVPKLVTRATDKFMKDNVPWHVVDAIKLEKEKSKDELSSMITYVVQKEYEHTKAKLLSQLYMKIKDDPQAQNVDFAVWIALKDNFQKSSTPGDSCRPDVFRRQYHDEHYNDDDAPPDRKSSTKRDQETNDDQVPSEEAKLEFLVEILGSDTKWVPPTTDKKMDVAFDNMMRSRCKSGPYTPSTITIPVVPATDDSLEVLERTAIETILNMSFENKAHYESEKEAIHLLLNGIGDEIYSTVDACKTAHEM
nr:hypothetical protein [Tanacetum cinerariifolium]